MAMLDADENRMIGLPYGEKNYDDMLSRFHLMLRTDGRTDRLTDLLSISRVCMLTRDKNQAYKHLCFRVINLCLRFKDILMYFCH